jgi:hypothetical protein
MGAAESNQRYSSLRYSTPRYEIKPDSYDFWNTVKPTPQVISTIEQPIYYSQSVPYSTQSYSTQSIPLTYASQTVSIPQSYVSTVSLPVSQPVPIQQTYVSRPVSIPQPYVTSAPTPLTVSRAYSPAPITYNTSVTPKLLPFRQEGETLLV